MKSTTTLTYRNFLSQVKSYHGAVDLASSEILSRFKSQPGLAGFQPDELLFMVDFPGHKFLIMLGRSSFLGYSRIHLNNLGPSFLPNLMHPEDFHIFDQGVFPAQLLFLRTHRADDPGKYTFSTTYRLKSKQGNWLAVSHRRRYIQTNGMGMPLISMDHLSDISHIKQDRRIINLVELGTENRQVLEIDAPNQKIEKSEQPISKRELNVLKCVGDGFSSKQIAEKLNISIHTINNHRKNMLGKTNCKNLSELVALASRTGIL